MSKNGGGRRRVEASTREEARLKDPPRTHRKLRAKLAARLRGDDADRLTELHQTSGGEVAAVATLAHATASHARKHRADADPLDARLVSSFVLTGVLHGDDAPSTVETSRAPPDPL